MKNFNGGQVGIGCNEKFVLFDEKMEVKTTFGEKPIKSDVWRQLLSDVRVDGFLEKTNTLLLH